MKLVLFCAEWCGSCREFKEHFNSIEIDGLFKKWLDIEDETLLLEDIDIDNLPTILAVSDDELSFYFGEIPPNKIFLEKILQNISLGKITPAYFLNPSKKFLLLQRKWNAYLIRKKLCRHVNQKISFRWLA